MRKRVKRIVRARSTVLFRPTRYENPKGLLFFLPSSTKEASGKFFESGAADYFALQSRRPKGVDQRIRSREVGVISGDPGVNEGSSKDGFLSLSLFLFSEP